MTTKELHKKWRKKFNEDCFARDKNQCVFCGETEGIQVHHITDRHEMPNGGYVMSNGITVCDFDHLECESHHMGLEIPAGYHPDDLYKMINSSLEQAIKDSEELC